MSAVTAYGCLCRGSNQRFMWGELLARSPVGPLGLPSGTLVVRLGKRYELTGMMFDYSTLFSHAVCIALVAAKNTRVRLATPQMAIGHHQNGHLTNCHAFGCTADRFPKWPFRILGNSAILWRQVAVLEMPILNSHLSQTDSRFSFITLLHRSTISNLIGGAV